MRILMTGASGNLASGVTEVLAPKHEIRLSDVFPIDSSLPFIQADVRKVGALDQAG